VNALLLYVSIALKSATYPLLIHKLVVGAIVNNICSKHRRGEMGIGLLRTDLRQLAVKDEIVALRPQVDGHFPTEQDESECISVLQSN